MKCRGRSVIREALLEMWHLYPNVGNFEDTRHRSHFRKRGGDTVTSTVTKSQTQEPYAQDDTLYPDPSPPAFKVNHSLRKNALGKAGLGGSIMHLRTPLPTAHHTPHTFFRFPSSKRGTHSSRTLCRRERTSARPHTTRPPATSPRLVILCCVA